MINYLSGYGEKEKDEILKYISPNELGERVEVKKTEMGGLFSPEACIHIIAHELGINVEIKEEIEKFEKINKELLKDVEGLPQHEWTFDEMDDTEYLMSVVGGILQFLEHKFPNALDISEMPIQRIIFQNARYRLYKRMNKIREKK